MRSTYLNPTVIGVLASVVAVSIVFGVLRNFIVTEPADLPAQSEQGAQLFNDRGCSQCHFADSAETRIGPGLMGLFDMETLPVSGRSVSAENVRSQFLDPLRRNEQVAEMSGESQDTEACGEKNKFKTVSCLTRNVSQEKRTQPY